MREASKKIRLKFYRYTMGMDRVTRSNPNDNLKNSPNNPLTILKIILFVFFSTCINVSAQQDSWGSEQNIELTPKERDWLKLHPNIVLGYTEALEPDIIVNKDGSYSGMVVDFLKALNEKLGIEMGLEIDSIPTVLENVQNKKIDGVLLLHPEYSKKLGLLSTNTFWPAYPTIFAGKGVHYEGPDDFIGKKVAIISGIYFTKKFVEQRARKATIIEITTALEGLQSIQTGEADFFIGASYHTYYIPKYHLFDIAPVKVFMDSPGWFGIGIRADCPELVSILNKGIAGFSKREIDAIFLKWSYLPIPQEIEFTAREKAWLDQNQTIRVKFWLHPPYFYLKDGKVVGIAVDLLNKISENTEIAFQLENHLDDFSEVISGLKEHTGPDLVGAIMPTPEREKDILFTLPYINSPRFIFARNNAPFISSIENLFGKKVAVVKEYEVHGRLVEMYPEINLLIFNNNKEALRAVSLGEADAFIGDLVSTPAMINEFGLKNLKATCPSGLPDHPLAMGVRNDWPELRDILNKALEAIPPQEKAAIINKWSTVKIDYGIKPVDIVKWMLLVIGIAVFVFGFLIFLNRKLKKIVEQRTATLSESEARFRATFEQAAVGIAHVSPEGKFVRINQKFCDIIGYSRNELLKLTFQNITHPDDLEWDMHQVELLLKGKKDSYSMEKRYFHKKGSTVWINLTVSLLRKEDGSPDYFVSVIEDISDRKQAENKIKESEENNRNLIDQTPVAIQIYLKDGTLTKLNIAYIKILGLSRENVEEIYDSYNLFTDKQVIESGLDIQIRKIFEGETITFPEYEFDVGKALDQFKISNTSEKKLWLRTNGFPVKNLDGKVTHAVFMSEDITERKNAEEKVLESENNYRILIEQAKDGIVLIQKGVIKFANNSLVQLSGFGCDELIDQPFDKFIAREELPKVAEYYEKRLKGEPAPSIYESIIIDKQGNHREVEFNSGLTNYMGENSLIITVRDISERKQAEKEIFEYQNRLKGLASELTIAEEKQRKQLADDLHDNIGQLLASSRIQLATLTSDMGKKEILDETQNISQGLLEAIQTIRHMIFDLSPPQLNEIGLFAATEDWLSEQIEQKHGIKINLTGEDKIFPMNNNIRLLVFRSIRELLMNVVKHAKASSVEVKIFSKNDKLKVIVEDDGIGFNFKPELLRLKNTGFGLFSIFERIGDLSGKVKVQSEPDKGTSIEMEIPLSE